VKPHRISFSLLLPVLSLVLLACLIAVPATLNYIALLQNAHGAESARLSFSDIVMTVPRYRFLPFAVDTAADRVAHLMVAVNLPATAIELALSRFSPVWPGVWVPFPLRTDSWRAIIDPVYCLPFWWFAGVGLDNLLHRRLLRWPLRLVGTILCGFFIFLALGLTFGLSSEDRVGTAWIFWGFGLWVVLFSSFPAAWIRSVVTARRAAHI
jgi:hypothetical protein